MRNFITGLILVGAMLSLVLYIDLIYLSITLKKKDITTHYGVGI